MIAALIFALMSPFADEPRRFSIDIPWGYLIFFFSLALGAYIGTLSHLRPKLDEIGDPERRKLEDRGVLAIVRCPRCGQHVRRCYYPLKRLILGYGTMTVLFIWAWGFTDSVEVMIWAALATGVLTHLSARAKIAQITAIIETTKWQLSHAGSGDAGEDTSRCPTCGMKAPLPAAPTGTPPTPAEPT